MNDMPTNDILDDRDIIARLRSALDEVAAAEPAVIETTDRRHPAAWLAVAAASVALVGGAGWALSHRSGTTTVVPGSSVAPVSAPAPTIVPPVTTTPTTTPSDIGATAAPWFTIDSATLVGDGVRRQFAIEGDDRPLFVTWRIVGDALDGFLFATVSPYAPDGPPEAEPGGSVEALTGVPDGQAWLVWPAAPAGDFVAPTLLWSRSDDSLWTFTQNGLYSAVSTNPWIDLVFRAQPGSGLPIVLADPRATVLTVGGPSTSTYTETYTSADGGGATLSVTDGGSAPLVIGTSDEVVPTIVVDRAGWQATHPDGQVDVVWDAGGGWWAQLHLTAELAADVDAIVTAVVPDGAAADAPTPTQQYYVEALLVDDGAGGIVARLPIDSQLQTGVPVLGSTWDEIEGEQTVDGVLQAGPVLLTVTWDGTAFTTVFVGTAVPEPDPVAPGPGCSDADGTLDRTMVALYALDQPSLGIAQYGIPTSGDCSQVVVYAWLDTPLLRAALDPVADAVDVRILLTPVPGD